MSLHVGAAFIFVLIKANDPFYGGCPFPKMFFAHPLGTPYADAPLDANVASTPAKEIMRRRPLTHP
jgi:hypothetical protein